MEYSEHQWFLTCCKGSGRLSKIPARTCMLYHVIMCVFSLSNRHFLNKAVNLRLLNESTLNAATFVGGCIIQKHFGIFCTRNSRSSHGLVILTSPASGTLQSYWFPVRRPCLSLSSISSGVGGRFDWSAIKNLQSTGKYPTLNTCKLNIELATSHLSRGASWAAHWNSLLIRFEKSSDLHHQMLQAECSEMTSLTCSEMWYASVTSHIQCVKLVSDGPMPGQSGQPAWLGSKRGSTPKQDQDEVHLHVTEASALDSLPGFQFPMFPGATRLQDTQLENLQSSIQKLPFNKQRLNHGKNSLVPQHVSMRRACWTSQTWLAQTNSRDMTTTRWLGVWTA